MIKSAWFPQKRGGTRKSGLAPWCFWPGCKAASPDALHPGKARESTAGVSSLSPAVVPGLSWARSPQTIRYPSAPGGACLLTSNPLFRQLRVQGSHRPGAGLGARSPQRSLWSGLNIVHESTTVKRKTAEQKKAAECFIRRFAKNGAKALFTRLCTWAARWCSGGSEWLPWRFRSSRRGTSGALPWELRVSWSGSGPHSWP